MFEGDVARAVAGTERIAGDELELQIGERAFLLWQKLIASRGGNGLTVASVEYLASRIVGYQRQSLPAVKKALIRLRECGLVEDQMPCAGWVRFPSGRHGRGMLRRVHGARVGGKEISVPAATITWIENHYRGRPPSRIDHDHTDGERFSQLTSDENGFSLPKGGYPQNEKVGTLDLTIDPPAPGGGGHSLRAKRATSCAADAAPGDSPEARQGDSPGPDSRAVRQRKKGGAVMEIKATRTARGVCLGFEGARPDGWSPPRPGTCGVPPPTTIDSLATCRIPNPPVLPEGLADLDLAWRLVKAFRGAYEARYGKPPRTIATRGQLKRGRYLGPLVEMGRELCEQGIPPAKWAVFSIDSWEEYKIGTGQPNIGWVFREKRLYDHIEWYSQERFFDGSRLYDGPKAAGVVGGYARLRQAIAVARCSEPWFVGNLMKALFPSGYAAAVAEARAENEEIQKYLDQQAADGDWIEHWRHYV